MLDPEKSCTVTATPFEPPGPSAPPAPPTLAVGPPAIAMPGPTPAPKARGRFYRPELDVLRFIAFMFVFGAHSMPTDHGGGHGFLSRLVGAGWNMCNFGVCLFFLLSSYLITELLQRERDTTGTIHMKAFYVRRILRIWPLYFGFLFIADLLVWGYLFPDKRLEPGRLLAFLFLAGNWYTAAFGFGNNPGSILWSVSLEEQFYLIWPSISKFFSKRAVYICCVALFPVAWIAIVVLTRMHANRDDAVWVNSFVQFQLFAAGALVAFSLKGRAPTFSAIARVGLAFGGIICWLVAAGACGLKEVGPAPHAFPVIAGYSLVTLGATAMFLSVIGLPAERMPRPLIYLGKISYGLYVFHVASGKFLLFEDKRLEARSPWFAHHHMLVSPLRAAASLSLTILLAHLSYRYFETPFLKLKERFTFVRSRSA